QQFIMIDGQGDPNTSKEFQEAVEALFSLSYALKFIIKKGKTGIDYGVMPLEGLWWSDDMTKFNVENKSGWKWTLMIMQPEIVTHELFDVALQQVQKKKNLDALAKLRLEAFIEGKAAQILYVGPFSEEGPEIENIHSYIKQNGYRVSGKHHEIYLSDITKTAPDKLKTIIRQPVS
ncbi:MAG: GyrI-like domain-containing protein, partial [Candidatus Omnitrophica bacterium]|nr:GyrI-like domain-containing protein [Candidatus Omnitrophota bacterium]